MVRDEAHIIIRGGNLVVCIYGDIKSQPCKEKQDAEVNVQDPTCLCNDFLLQELRLSNLKCL